MLCQLLKVTGLIILMYYDYCQWKGNWKLIEDALCCESGPRDSTNQSSILTGVCQS
jgi:hypothetical protein